MRWRLLSILCWLFCTGAYSQSDTSLILKHLHAIVDTEKPRMHTNVDVLDEVANYLFSQFSEYTSEVSYQPFQVGGKTYRNVIASFGPMDAQRIVVGAHYDVCDVQPGADDNATGVVGLLELGRLLQNVELDYRIDLVAYSLEEPPHFRTKSMGSYHHAKMMHDEGVDIKGMIVLEMIGYFDSSKGSQEYPVGLLKVFYGSRGDYITVVKKFAGGRFARKFNRKFDRAAVLPSKTFTGPKILPGIDFSDHLNYWKFGYSSLMITDTAFYRNKNYHRSTDTIDTIDVPKMALVINAVFQTLLAL